MQFDIYLADLSPIMGKGKEFIRPVIVLQKAENTPIICTPVTSRDVGDDIPGFVKTKNGKEMRILWEQVRAVDKYRFKEKIDEVSVEDVSKDASRIVALILDY